jgi:hypothetical protein
MKILITRDGQQLGPYTPEQVNEYLAAGSLSPNDPAWHEGLAEWVPLNQVGGIVVPAASTPPPFDPGAFGASPPPPTSPPPPVASGPPPAAGPPMAMGAACPQCNVTVQPDQVVCMNCGSHLRALPSAGKKGAGKLIAIIGGGVLALGAAVVVVIFVVKAMGPSAKDNRIKCVYNLSSIGKATLGFNQDNDGRTPWNLIPSQRSNHFGTQGGTSAGQIFGLAAMKSELQTAKILVSPCDSARIADNEVLQAGWANINTKGGNPVTGGTSYIFCQGGDFQRPATVIALTRNLVSDNIAAGNWSGADEDPVPTNAMEGLSKSQGQLVLADGSAKQSTDADLGASGKVVKGHIVSRGGTSPLGNSSTAVIR